MGQNQVKGDVESPESTPFLGGEGVSGEGQADPNTNYYPLHLAASSGDLEKVKELLNNGCDHNTSVVSDSLTRGVDGNGRTPLHCATLPDSSHNLNVIQLLVQRDKEDPSSEGKPLLVNLQDSSKKTALHYAAKSLKPQVVSLLLELGADPNLKDADGDTLLHILAKSNSDAALECARLILDSPSFSVPAANSNSKDAFCGWTPLHVAACFSASKLLRLFIERGFDFAALDDLGRTPLITVSWNGPDESETEDNLECGRLLLDAYSPEQVNVRGDDGVTALMVATCTKLMKLLIASPKTDLFAKNSSGNTVFFYAICRNSLPAVKVLCECEQMKANNKAKFVEIFFNSHEKDKNNGDKGLIQRALLYRQTKTVEYLLKAHPNPLQWMDDHELMSLIYSETPIAITWSMNERLRYDPYERDETVSMNFLIIAGVKDPVEEKLQETKSLYQITKAPKEEQKLILLHPLVQIFLRIKWGRIRQLTWIHTIIQLSWIVSYTLMVCEMYRPNCHDTGANQSQNGENGDGGGGGAERKGHMRILTSLGILQWKEDCMVNQIAVQVTAVILYILSALVLVKEGLQIMLKPKAYFRDFINFVQLGLLVVAVVNSAPAWQVASASDVAPWQTNLAAIGICVAWVMLLSELDNFPKCAVYSGILKRVLRTCLKTMLFYCPLLIGFAMCFRLLTPGKGQHNYLLFSLIKVVVMMTGELEFEDAFYGDDHDTTSGPSTSFSAILGQIMFLLLVVVTTIALLNLLTGLAVADVRKLLEDAEVDRLSMQLERMYMFDSFILLAREKLPYLDSWKNLLYRWTANSEWGCDELYYSCVARCVMKDFPMELQTSIRKVLVGVQEEE